MILTFLPVRMDDRLTVERRGDVLILNGDAFDFAPLPDGAILPPEATRFPVPLTLDADGPVALPPHSAESADED